MRTTVDIPDALYRGLKAKAATEGTTVKAILVRLVDEELQPTAKPAGKRVKLPLIRSKRSDKITLTPEDIDEIAFG